MHTRCRWPDARRIQLPLAPFLFQVRGMQMIKTIAAMRRLTAQWKEQKAAIGLVPTMGYLHAGHASLMAEARRQVGPSGRVVVSVFVNPTQFAPTEDLSKYPRDLERDTRLCQEAGVDALFVPPDAEMYPSGFSAYVVEETLSKRMEGASRPAHFRGVTTVVAKLFNIAQPDAAVFGAKDFQQAAIVQRMVRDLDFPLRIIVAPTVREPDGLAMSSRNQYLSIAQRAQAPVLWRSLQYARQAVLQGPVAASELREGVARVIASAPEARLDYAEFFDPLTLEPSATAQQGVHMALAVFVGKTRLIDNGGL
jgi:pantoate--beta-alanine ligase